MGAPKAAMHGLMAAMILLVVPPGLWAQSASTVRSVLPQQAQVAPAVAPKSAPTAVPLAEIAVEFEATNSRLRQILRELAPDPAMNAEETQLSSLLGQTRELAQAIGAGRSLLMDELAEQRRALRLLELRLDVLSDGAARRSQKLDKLREELRGLDQTWRAVRETAAQSDLPASMKARITSTLESIQDAAAKLKERRSEAYGLQDRVSSAKAELETAVLTLEAQVDRARVQLFHLDSSPLWQAFRTTGAPGGEGSIRAAWGRGAATVARYFAAEHERLAVHLLLYVGLVGLALWVSRRSRSWLRGEEYEAHALELMNHPIAAASLVAIFATYYLYPDAPLPVLRLPVVLFIAPLLGLLPGLMPPQARPALYSLAALFLAQRLEGLVTANELVHRAVLLGILLLAIVVAVVGLRTIARAGGMPRSERLKRLVKTATVLLAVALLCNVVGNVSLAVTLARGVIGSAFWLVMLLAVVRIFEGFTDPLLRSPAARLSRALTAHRDLIRRRYFAVLRFAAQVSWVALTLAGFGILAPVVAAVRSVLTHSWAVGQFHLSLGTLVLFVASVWLSVLAARFTAFLLEEDLLSRTELPKGLPATLSMAVRYAIILAGFLLALTITGVQWSQLALVAGGVGVGVGLGLQSYVSNVVAGFVLAFERPIRAGDVVEAGSMIGEVTRIGLRSSVIRTFEGAEIIVPNNELVSRQFVNWTLSDQVRRIEIPVGVDYGTDPRRVLRLLLDVTRDRPDILQKPEPVVLFRGFGESSLNFVLRFHTGDFANWPLVASEVTLRISDTLKAEGIAIPFPQRDIHIRSGSLK